MEDEPPIDAHLRSKALQMAISFRAIYAGPNADADPRIAVAVAKKFYDFLKGETK